jgi:hypothetical protein
MPNPKRMIKIGDIVDVYFQGAAAEFNCVVEYKPQSTGDCWYLWKADGFSIAVMHFEKMVKKN